MKTMNLMDCDPDFRRKPKTDCYCMICQKDIKGAHRVILMTDNDEIIHPSSDIPAEVKANFYSVGNDCAKRIGIDWTARA